MPIHAPPIRMRSRVSRTQIIASASELFRTRPTRATRAQPYDIVNASADFSGRDRTGRDGSRPARSDEGAPSVSRGRARCAGPLGRAARETSWIADRDDSLGSCAASASSDKPSPPSGRCATDRNSERIFRGLERATDRSSAADLSIPAFDRKDVDTVIAAPSRTVGSRIGATADRRRRTGNQPILEDVAPWLAPALSPLTFLADAFRSRVFAAVRTGRRGSRPRSSGRRR